MTKYYVKDSWGKFVEWFIDDKGYVTVSIFGVTITLGTLGLVYGLPYIRTYIVQKRLRNYQRG